jgi:hypothetical protein
VDEPGWTWMWIPQVLLAVIMMNKRSKLLKHEKEK